MGAAELATVVEGWATLAGLMVVVAGAVFAGVQLRRDAQARRLQALVDVFTVVWPREMLGSSNIVLALPDDWDITQLEPAEREAVSFITMTLNRLGYVLRTGLVQEHEAFEFPRFAHYPIILWEKLKHDVRKRSLSPGGIHGATDFEYAAWRAQAYFTEHAEKRLGAIPVFDADVEAVNHVSQKARQARMPAS